jgi:hypothetical protein
MRQAQVTAVEAARRWAALQLRPEAALFVGRVSVETSELLKMELLRYDFCLDDGFCSKTCCCTSMEGRCAAALSPWSTSEHGVH